VKFHFHPLIFFFPVSLIIASYLYFRLHSDRPDQLLIKTGIMSAVTMLPLILLLPPFLYFLFAYVITFLVFFVSSKLKKYVKTTGRLYRVFFWLLLTSGLYEWQLIFLKWRNDAVYQISAQQISCDHTFQMCSGPGGYWKLPSGWTSAQPTFFTANFNADLTRQIRAFPHAMYFHAAGGELFGTLSAADAQSDITLKRIFDYIKENQTYMWALPLPPEIKPEIFSVRGVDCMVMALEFYSLKKMGRETLFLLAASPGKKGSFLFLFRLPSQGSLPYYIDRIVSGFSFIDKK
jgi:hypothetical protein